MEDFVLAWTHIAAAVFGAVSVAVANHWATKRRERLAVKRALLQRICGGRAHILGLAAVQSVGAYEALNEVPVAYADDPAVLEAVRQLHEQRRQSERLPDNLVSLVKVMAKSAHIDLSILNDSFILEPFTPESLPAQREQSPGAVAQRPRNGSKPQTITRVDERPSQMGEGD